MHAGVILSSKGGEVCPVGAASCLQNPFIIANAQGSLPDTDDCAPDPLTWLRGMRYFPHRTHIIIRERILTSQQAIGAASHFGTESMSCRFREWQGGFAQAFNRSAALMPEQWLGDRVLVCLNVSSCTNTAAGGSPDVPF
jgi:hypothetical protein